MFLKTAERITREVTKSTLTHIFQNATIAPQACPPDTAPHLHLQHSPWRTHLRTPTLFMPHLHAPSLWFRKLPEELLNINTFGNGLSIMQPSAFRSWKNPNKCSQTSEHYTVPHKTSMPLKDFPSLDSLLNCFIHSPQKERFKKPNIKTTNTHPPKTKTTRSSEQPEVWATYWGLLLCTNSLIKSKQTKSITTKALESQRFPCLWRKMLLHLIHILLLSYKKYSSV